MDSRKKVGRPPLPEGQRVTGKDVHLLIPDEIIQQIDVRKGDKTRKDFILKALRYYLEQQED